VSRPGSAAPAFRAPARVRGEITEVSRADDRHRWLVPVFPPLAFAYVCPTGLHAFARRREAFHGLGAEVLAVSVAGVGAHRAWPERDLPEVPYPDLSDRTRAVCRASGVLSETRGAVIVDSAGIVRYQAVGAAGPGRPTNEVLRCLQARQVGAPATRPRGGWRRQGRLAPARRWAPPGGGDRRLDGARRTERGARWSSGCSTARCWGART
jgi:alkyl hydroperoxide reductase subunit AhpC